METKIRQKEDDIQKNVLAKEEKVLSRYVIYKKNVLAKEEKVLSRLSLVAIIFPCLNFPSSFLNGKSNQNKQCQQTTVFCLISYFFKFET